MNRGPQGDGGGPPQRRQTQITAVAQTDRQTTIKRQPQPQARQAAAASRSEGSHSGCSGRNTQERQDWSAGDRPFW